MRLSFSFLVLCLVAGCSTPPKPQQCEGEFRPVNSTVQGFTNLGAAQSLALCNKGSSHVQVG